MGKQEAQNGFCCLDLDYPSSRFQRVEEFIMFIFSVLHYSWVAKSILQGQIRTVSSHARRKLTLVDLAGSEKVGRLC